MIVKSKPMKPLLFKAVAGFIRVFLKMRFNKLVIKKTAIKPNHSYILMCNHFSFIDGLLAIYLCNEVLWGENGMKRLYIMSLKKQMEKNKWLKYIGSFSVEPGSWSLNESFDYAAQILSEPGNLLLFYPQGNLESCHISHINFEAGLAEIVPKIKGDTQLLWCSNLVEYFESTKPSIYFTMADCGTNHEFDFEQLQKQVNAYHKNALKQNIRFTNGPM